MTDLTDHIQTMFPVLSLSNLVKVGIIYNKISMNNCFPRNNSILLIDMEKEKNVIEIFVVEDGKSTI